MRVTIQLTATQRLDGDSATERTTVNGTMEWRGQAVRLAYRDETQTDTTVTVMSGRVIITRKGEFSSTLILEKDLLHLCPYATPYGEMTLGVTATAIVNRLNPNGGRLTFAYTLDMGGGMTTDHVIEILVKEVSQS